MPFSARKQRELAAREQLFFETALSMIQQEGFINLQMSRLAAAAEYSTGRLYQHFACKEDLLLALTNNMLNQRAELFGHIACWEVTPRERLLGMGVADMLTTRVNPQFLRFPNWP